MNRAILLAVLVATSAAQAESAPLELPVPATAPASPRDPMEVTVPDWIARPTGEDVLKGYPRKALGERISGRAVIRCKVDGHGGLEACEVTSQWPEGLGFGEAALALAPTFRMKLVDLDGNPVPVGAKVPVPMIFNPPEP